MAVKLTKTVWNPNDQLNMPGHLGFHFTHDLERNIKECFPPLRDYVIGLSTVKSLPEFLSAGWNRLHIRESFEDTERAEAKETLRSRCGCHVAGERSIYDDNERAEDEIRDRSDSRLVERDGSSQFTGGWIMFRHYFVCYMHKSVADGRLRAEQQWNNNQLYSALEDQDAKMEELTGVPTESKLEKEQMVIQPPAQRAMSRGPGRPRKEA